MPRITCRYGKGRTLLCSLFGLILLLGSGPLTPGAQAGGEEEFKAGQLAEQRGDYDEALRQYQAALKLEPQNPQYLIATERSRFQAAAAHVERGHRLRDSGNLEEALREYETAAGIDPSSPVARQAVASTREQMEELRAGGPETEPGMPSLREATGPPELRPLSRVPINFRATQDGRVILETIGRLAGINVLFDQEFRPTQPVSVELNNVSLEEALNQVMVLTRGFWKPLNQNTIFVMPDTAVKRREQEQQIIKTFYLSNTITPQELTEIVTAIRTLLETRRIQQVNSMNAIILRDTPAKVALAEKIIRDIDKAKSEVVVDVAILEVRRDKARQLGLAPGEPGLRIPITFTPGGSAPDSGSPSVTLKEVPNVGTGDYSVTLPGATLNALLSDNSTKILQRPEVRASDGIRASLRIGDRVPIATGSYQPGVAGQTVSALVQTQFQYLDVGVNMDITPKVHTNREITLKVRIEVSAVTQFAEPVPGVRQPVIGQRVIEHDIRLREGEINVLGGILQTQETEQVSGIPGLSQIPLLRYLFSNVSNTTAESEVLIVLRPHAVRVPDITPFNVRAIDIGTEGDIRLREATDGADPNAEPAPEPPQQAPEAAPPVPPAAPAPANPFGPAGAQAPPAGPTASLPVAEPSVIPAAAAAPVAAGGVPPASADDQVAAAAAAEPAHARIRLPGTQVSTRNGETFQVAVRVENIENAFSIPLEVLYDPGALKLLRVDEGTLLSSGGQPVIVTQQAAEGGGRLTLSFTRPEGSSGVSGSDTVAVLTFQATRPATTSLAIVPADVRTPTRTYIPVEPAQATVIAR
jgi:general secretion pathway protein D